MEDLNAVERVVAKAVAGNPIAYRLDADVKMTLTSPGCPVGPQILASAQAAAGTVEGVDEADVNLVWKPFWTQDRIDPAVRAVLGF